MRFSIIAAIVAGTSAVIAMPAALDSRQTVFVCTGTDSNAQCCSTDVLGLADLDCAAPTEQPTSVDDFTAICAAGGQRARCCLLPVLGQALVCSAPVGA